IYFFKNCRDGALAKAVAKERLVTKGASPGTTASKLQLGPNAFALKDVVPMAAQLDWVPTEIQRPKLFHVGCGQVCADVNRAFVAPAASGDFRPGFCGQIGNSVIRFTTQCYIALQLPQARAR